jgi:hypothetical protein
MYNVYKTINDSIKEMFRDGNMKIIYIIGYVKKRKLKQRWSTIPPISKIPLTLTYCIQKRGT